MNMHLDVIIQKMDTLELSDGDILFFKSFEISQDDLDQLKSLIRDKYGKDLLLIALPPDTEVGVIKASAKEEMCPMLGCGPLSACSGHMDGHNA